MAQIFSRPAVVGIRLALLVGILLLVAAVPALRALLGYASAFGAPIGEPVSQPVPFSHEHHVGEDGLDCRYCHASVEESAFAGMPSTATCMTCHSVIFSDASMLAPVRSSWDRQQPIHWRRINDLPDFVYFDHSIHVANGVGCVSCHGRVDRMPLTWRTKTLEMQWCLDCHREPERYLRPKSRVFDMDSPPSDDQLALGRALVAEFAIEKDHLTECWVCHR
jgi:hypothetical protein